MRKLIIMCSAAFALANLGHHALADEARDDQSRDDQSQVSEDSFNGDQDDVAALDSNDGYFLAENDFAARTPDSEGSGSAGEKVEGSGRGHGPCGKLNLDDEQKKKMKDAIFKFRENKIDLEAQVKKAKLKLEHVMGDANATEKSATAAAKNLNESISKLREAKSELKTQIAFSILKPEQRGPAQMCHAMMKHGHHHHRTGEWAHEDHGPAPRGEKHEKRRGDREAHNQVSTGERS